jgi:hypothetical protein
VAQARADAPRVSLVRTRSIRVTAPNALEGALRREIDAHGAALLDVQHDTAVELTVELGEHAVPTFVARVADLSQGAATIDGI